MTQIKTNDVWLIHFPVPDKKEDELLRPFLVLENTNNKLGGVPITSFTDIKKKWEIQLLMHLF